MPCKSLKEWELETAELRSNYKTLQKLYNLATERNQVMQNKRNVLTEMLTNIFHVDIQDIIMRPAQHEPVRQENTPHEIVHAVQHYIHYYWKCDTTRCDLNTRVCWATIYGQLNRDWVICRTESTHEFNAAFIHEDVSEWPNVYAQWRDEPKKTQ